VGEGRLAELPRIVDAVVDAIGDRPVRAPDAAARPPLVPALREADLTGRRIVVTAGGTREAIDPVRYLGNRSTGKMGAALTAAALDRGAEVTVVAGALEVPLPEGARVIRVESTEEMAAALREAMGLDAAASVDALVMAAAVADFRPAQRAGQKLARDGALTLQLEATPDVLAGVAAEVRRLPAPHRPVLVGFAAETGSLERAAGKLAAKGVDLLVANDVAEAGSGFGTDTNRVTILDAAGGRDELPLLTKREVADRILDRVARALDDRNEPAQTVGSTHGRAAR
ncbi:MAG TPA: phosphopantothenoylcysteine decarboxylase, partial [Candidatus Limnocylindrales bacterium]|nr:phosphopantothenoylcysteine decarboxylase [Candidatus Limnocylindrales bacterium]